MKSIKIFFTLASLILIQGACTKFVAIDPPVSQITDATVYSTNSSAAAAMTSVYENMIVNSGGMSSGPYSFSVLNGLAADELTNYSSDPFLSEFYTNTINSRTPPNFWFEIYNEIYTTNAVLEGVSGSSGVTVSVKQQLTGEAKFMRAFLHFYATNLFGDVPLVTTTNYLVNNSIHKSTQADVYTQIISDLQDAQKDLGDDYWAPNNTTTTERVRPNKGAASAMLARVYLYTGNWTGADSAASAVINNSSLYSLDTLNGVFLANSTEAIWQLQPVSPAYNTFDGNFFILTSPPGTGQYEVALSPYLLNTFETGDQRFSNWIDSLPDPDSGKTYYYPFKYKIYLVDPNQPITEYLMVMRLAEQYLIRAEARAQENNLPGAAADLNIIRSRAGLTPTGASSQTDLLAAINHERQVELFTEWGHRWFDLKRTGNLNSVLGSPGNICTVKGGVWSPNWQIEPIPQSEIVINSNLTQNPGY